MSQPARIEDDPRNPLLLGSVHAFYQGSLMVALKSLQASALALRYATEPLVDARKGFLPIDARLAGTQHVEIGAVNDQDSFWYPRAWAQCALWLGHKGSLGPMSEIVQCSAQFDYECERTCRRKADGSKSERLTGQRRLAERQASLRPSTAQSRRLQSNAC